MNLPKSPKTQSSKSPTTTKEGKEADPLAGIEDLVEDLPEKAPKTEEGKEEEIIEDIDASSFDLNPEEEAELAQALEKEPGEVEKSAKVPAAKPVEAPEVKPGVTPEPEVEESAETPPEGEEILAEGEETLAEGVEAPAEGEETPPEGAEATAEGEGVQVAPGEQAEEAVSPPEAGNAPSGPIGEGAQPAVTAAVVPAAGPEGVPSGEGKGASEAVPAEKKEVKFETEPLAIEKALDEKSFVKAQIEASLFVSDKPVSTEDLSIKLEVRKTLVAEMLKELMMDYMDRVTSLEIVKVGEDTYTMQIRPEYTSKVKKFASHGLIPEGVMRTLTIIALKQPIAKSLLVKLRGSGAYEHVKDLEDRGLVRSERAGRTQNVTTTDQFADMFGLSREVKKMVLQLKAQLGVKEDDVKEDTTPKAPPPVPEG